MEANQPKLSSLEQEAVDEKTSGDRLKELATINLELARLVASNPSAPPELLRYLGTSYDKVTRRGVASNPNTPTNILLKLGEEFPKELLANSMLPLLYLENQNFIQEMPRLALRNLLTQDEVPIYILESASSHYSSDVLKLIAQHTNTPDSALEQIAAKSRESSIGWCLVKRSGLSTRVLEKLAEHAAGEVLLYLAQHPNTPGSVLERIADQKWVVLLKAVARNPNTPLPILERLANDTDIKVKKVLAKHSHLNANIVAELALNHQLNAKGLLLQNRKISTSVLEQLQSIRIAKFVKWLPSTRTLP